MDPWANARDVHKSAPLSVAPPTLSGHTPVKGGIATRDPHWDPSAHLSKQAHEAKVQLGQGGRHAAPRTGGTVSKMIKGISHGRMRLG